MDEETIIKRTRSEIEIEVTYAHRESMEVALMMLVRGLRSVLDSELYVRCIHVMVPANMSVACFLSNIYPFAMEVARKCSDGAVEFKYGSPVRPH
jgi:hypothetical protein